MTDKELIQASIVGDKAAFKTIVEKYQGQVAATVYGMLGKCLEAQDVGQEVFIKFYQSLKAFRNESGIGTYLTRIAVNLCLNKLKQRKRESIRISNDDPDCLPDSSESKNILLKNNLRQAILGLEPGYRAVVVLRLIRGYSTKETADILKAPQGSVMSWLARAQEKLRDKLNMEMLNEQ